MAGPAIEPWQPLPRDNLVLTVEERHLVDQLGGAQLDHDERPVAGAACGSQPVRVLSHAARGAAAAADPAALPGVVQDVGGVVVPVRVVVALQDFAPTLAYGSA